MTEEQLAKAVSVLARGGVVAAATETYFGLLADARRSDALDRVFALKRRPADKGVTLLLPHASSWSSWVVEIPELARRLAERFWPGPLTIALPARRDIDPRLTVEGTVAVRWGAPSPASRIAENSAAPLTATSANLAGQPPCLTSEAIDAAFAEPLRRGDLTLVPGQAPGGVPSTLVVVAGDRVRVARRGRIDVADLAAAIAPAALE
ncbi:MAG TPA: L-threonylcarbamoyladenylate synthase [Polyangiaceae bacterium]